MRWKTIIIGIVILIVLRMLIAHAQPVFSLNDSYWQAPPMSGVNDTLYVILEHESLGENVSLNATLTIQGVARSNLTANASYVGYLGQGALLPLKFQVNIPSGDLASYYPAQLLIQCNNTSTIINFNVGFSGGPSFTVTSDKQVLSKGENNSVTITVKVMGAPARNVEVRVTPASAFVTVLGESLSRKGLVNVGETLTLPINVMVDSSAGDSVALTVTISSEDFTRTPTTQTVTIGFQVVRTRGLPFFTLTLTPNIISSGQRTQAYLYITNTGPSPAKDVRVSVSGLSPGLAVLSGSSASLGDFAPGETKVLPLVLRADRTAVGVAQLQLSFSFFDESGNPHTSMLNVGFEVARSPTPILSISLLNGTLPYGLNSKLAASIINIGDATAQDITVDASPGPGVYVLGTSRSRIKQLSPGASSLITLLVRSTSLEGSGTLSFRIHYYDDYGNAYDDIIQVSFNVSRSGAEIKLILLNETLNPNQVNRVLLLINNTGSIDVKNLTLTLTSQSPDIGSVIGPSNIHLGSLPHGNSTLVTFNVFVQPKVYGALQLLAAVSYTLTDGRFARDVYTLGFEVHGDWELSVSSVTTVPTAIFPGDNQVMLRVTFVNSGDYMAKNVQVDFLGDQWVKPSSASSAEAFIPYLPVGQTVTINFLADIRSDAPIGNHRLAVNASGRTIYFTLTVLEKATFNIRNVTSLEVTRGGRGYRLVYEVENTSNMTADDVRVEMFSPFVTGTTSVYIGTLSGHERKLVTFEVDIDQTAPIGELPVDFRVSWTQENRNLDQYIRNSIHVNPPKPISNLVFVALILIFLVLLGYMKRETLKTFITRVARVKAESTKTNSLSRHYSLSLMRKLF